MPLVLDLEQQNLHWLDVHAKGQLQMNNVANSNSDIASICPTLMNYFGSGTRPSMYELGLLHAAARCDQVTIRGDSLRSLVRQEGESRLKFLSRLRSQEFGTETTLPRSDQPVLALLLVGDLNLPSGSSIYTLFSEKTTSTVSASDFL